METFDINGFDESWCQQLDKAGMQPHSREYLEYQMNNLRSYKQFNIDIPTNTFEEAIQFTDLP